MLKEAFKALTTKSDKLVFSEEFDTGDSFTVSAQAVLDGSDPLVVFLISEDGHSLTLPNEQLAEYVRLGLALLEDEAMSKTKRSPFGCRMMPQWQTQCASC